MMKTLVLSSIVLLAICGVAHAATIALKGTAADKFIAKYLPGAEIPGPVKGTISCNVPAMGARSDGAVSTCSIKLRWVQRRVAGEGSMMLQVSSGGYRLGVALGALPLAHDLYAKHATFYDDLDSRGSDGEAAFITVARHAEDWPRLVISLRHRNVPSFDFGLHAVEETGRLLIGDFDRLIAYDLVEPRRLWLEETCSGFWRWARHADVVVMSAELDIAAYSLRGELMWTRFVEPPWSYTVAEGRVRLDVMGEVSTFPLHAGP